MFVPLLILRCFYRELLQIRDLAEYAKFPQPIWSPHAESKAHFVNISFISSVRRSHTESWLGWDQWFCAATDVRVVYLYTAFQLGTISSVTVTSRLAPHGKLPVPQLQRAPQDGKMGLERTLIWIYKSIRPFPSQIIFVDIVTPGWRLSCWARRMRSCLNWLF